MQGSEWVNIMYMQGDSRNFMCVQCGAVADLQCTGCQTGMQVYCGRCAVEHVKKGGAHTLLRIDIPIFRAGRRRSLQFPLPADISAARHAGHCRASNHYRGRQFTESIEPAAAYADSNAAKRLFPGGERPEGLLYRLEKGSGKDEDGFGRLFDVHISAFRGYRGLYAEIRPFSTQQRATPERLNKQITQYYLHSCAHFQRKRVHPALRSLGRPPMQLHRLH